MSTSSAVRSSTGAAPPGRPAPVDPRGQRFAAALTTVVLVLVLVTGNGWLLAAQAVVFALGARGVSPYGLLYARLVRPRLGPPAHLEDARPPRFAQVVGLVFAVVGVLAFAAGLTVPALVATAAALVAAFLNAVFGVCLGCELYLFIHRLTHRTASTARFPRRSPAPNKEV